MHVCVWSVLQLHAACCSQKLICLVPCTLLQMTEQDARQQREAQELVRAAQEQQGPVPSPAPDTNRRTHSAVARRNSVEVSSTTQWCALKVQGNRHVLSGLSGLKPASSSNTRLFSEELCAASFQKLTGPTRCLQ